MRNAKYILIIVAAGIVIVGGVLLYGSYYKGWFLTKPDRIPSVNEFKVQLPPIPEGR